MPGRAPRARTRCAGAILRTGPAGDRADVSAVCATARGFVYKGRGGPRVAATTTEARMTTRPWAIAAALALLAPAAARAATLQVGPGQPYAKPCAAIAAAANGDTILIDAAGDYAGDVCAVTRSGLTLRGINGRPHIDAAGQHAEGKAIWVIKGANTTVDNIEFSGCRVPDQNGAGLRVEADNLVVRHSWFHHNEMGILTGNDRSHTITIEYSEFSDNGYGDGYSHNVYVGHHALLVFRYNWSRASLSGHLLKSRAERNEVLYNRLTGEAGGTESYELTFPNGGLSFVIGNLIEQPATSENSAMLDYLSEGFGGNTDDRLFVVNNTFVNNRGSGTFLAIRAATQTPAIVRNNVFWGGGTVSSQASAVLDHNVTGNADDWFVDPANYDYRLRATASALIDAGTAPGTGAGESLAPTQVYLHPVAGAARPVVGAIDVGAYEWAGDGIFDDGFEQGVRRR